MNSRFTSFHLLIMLTALSNAPFALANEEYDQEQYAEESYEDESYAEEDGYAEESYLEDNYVEETFVEENYTEEAYQDEPYQQAEPAYEAPQMDSYQAAQVKEVRSQCEQWALESGMEGEDKTLFVDDCVYSQTGF